MLIDLNDRTSVEDGYRLDRTANSLDLYRFCMLIKRQWWIVAIATLTGVVVGVCYILAIVPVYTATASILINNRAVQPLEETRVPSDADAAAIDSMGEIIRSGRVAAAVADNLSLYSNPFFFSNMSSRLIPVRMVNSLLGEQFGLLDVQQQPSMDEARQIAVQHLRENVEVTRVPRTNVYDISYTSIDPDMSIRIANAFVEAFGVSQMSARIDAAHGATEWLQKRLEELRRKSADADRQLQRLRSGVIATPDEDRLSEIRELEQKAETYRSIHQQFLQRLERATQQETFAVSDIRIITSAWMAVPPKPSHPRKSLTLVLSAVLGGMIGIGIASLRILLSK